MTPHLLIHTIVDQTVVFIAQLATSGGVRAPLAQVADQVFRGLAHELRGQGIRQNVIADMFGLAVRTYHRRVQSVEQSKTVEGTTVWAAVLDYIRDHQPISAAKVQQRFSRDEPEVVSGVLRDLTDSGLVYRAGRGARAVFRATDASDFDADADDAAIEHLVWLMIYREGPLSVDQLSNKTGIAQTACETAVASLVKENKVKSSRGNDGTIYSSDRFEVFAQTEHGWEAAVLDHYRAMVSAIRTKLSGSSPYADLAGGSTWSFDVWPGHPLEERAKQSLSRLRQELSALRAEIDLHNAAQPSTRTPQRVVVYAGQYVTDLEGQNNDHDDENKREER